MAEEEKKTKKGISRRDFIKGTGLAVGGVAISSTVLSVACNPSPTPTTTTTPPATTNTTKPATPTTTPPTTTAPPAQVVAAPPGVVTLNINNRSVVAQVQPEWSLAFVLRNKLGLVGTKVGCDRGECGSCNILVDGKPHLACTMMAIESEGKKIVTIEGLPTGPTLHPVQKLFLDNNTFQCGFCTPGMIMSSVALLTKTPKPTVSQVKEALAGNLCYCGDYTRIIKTVALGL
jgi:xanthine dehydrogenase YagT iron-sulfur-binding subunit